MKTRTNRLISYANLVLLGFLFLSCNQTAPTLPNQIVIDIWYGQEQHFGKTGNAQWQINILGNIKPKFKNSQAYYVLNSGPEKNYLTLGCDLHRLAQEGDFNIEIPRKDLLTGKNVVDLYIELEGKILKKEKIFIDYNDDKTWPLPYSVKWSEVANIKDVVEIVDGNWELTDSGIRTNYKYYDRIIAFGDSTWKNYEIETTVIFHGYTPPEAGPPTYDVSHIAIASRWPGHDQDELQPHRKWFPLGATSEFRITENYENCRWRIFDGENFFAEQSHKGYRTIQPQVKYRIKHRVEDFTNNSTLYSVKFWQDGKKEPADWDFQAVENSMHERGSACIIAHNTDVTFGDISAIPID